MANVTIHQLTEGNLAGTDELVFWSNAENNTGTKKMTASSLLGDGSYLKNQVIDVVQDSLNDGDIILPSIEVTGADDYAKAGSQILDEANLDEYLTPGNYYIDSDSISIGITNTPTAGNIGLQVKDNGEFITQIATDDDNNVYTRSTEYTNITVGNDQYIPNLYSITNDIPYTTDSSENKVIYIPNTSYVQSGSSVSSGSSLTISIDNTLNNTRTVDTTVTGYINGYITINSELFNLNINLTPDGSNGLNVDNYMLYNSNGIVRNEVISSITCSAVSSSGITIVITLSSNYSGYTYSYTLFYFDNTFLSDPEPTEGTNAFVIPSASSGVQNYYTWVKTPEAETGVDPINVRIVSHFYNNGWYSDNDRFEALEKITLVGNLNSGSGSYTQYIGQTPFYVDRKAKTVRFQISMNGAASQSFNNTVLATIPEISSIGYWPSASYSVPTLFIQDDNSVGIGTITVTTTGGIQGTFTTGTGRTIKGFITNVEYIYTEVTST